MLELLKLSAKAGHSSSLYLYGQKLYQINKSNFVQDPELLGWCEKYAGKGVDGEYLQVMLPRGEYEPLESLKKHPQILDIGYGEVPIVR